MKRAISDEPPLRPTDGIAKNSFAIKALLPKTEQGV